MRVNLDVVGDPSWQLTHDGFGIWSRTDADIVALDRANEGFSQDQAGKAGIQIAASHFFTALYLFT